MLPRPRGIYLTTVMVAKSGSTIPSAALNETSPPAADHRVGQQLDTTGRVETRNPVYELQQSGGLEDATATGDETATPAKELANYRPGLLLAHFPYSPKSYWGERVKMNTMKDLKSMILLKPLRQREPLRHPEPLKLRGLLSLHEMIPLWLKPMVNPRAGVLGRGIKLLYLKAWSATMQ